VGRKDTRSGSVQKGEIQREKRKKHQHQKCGERYENIVE